MPIWREQISRNPKSRAILLGQDRAVMAPALG
jgi:hypothetical protein